MNPWYGVDLDGTLAEYDGFKGPDIIGLPIPRMLARVKQWLAEGIEVRIFTARVYSDGSEHRNREAAMAREAITDWCVKHIGQPLKITCQKDYGMLWLFDDRCVQVRPNSGAILTEEGWA